MGDEALTANNTIPIESIDDDSDTGILNPFQLLTTPDDKENLQEPINTRNRGKKQKPDAEPLRPDEAVAKLQRKHDDEKKKLADQLKKNDDDKKKLKQQLKKWQDADAKNKAEIAHILNKLDNALSDVGTLNAQLASAQANLKDKEEEMTDLHKLMIERDEEISDLMTQLVRTNDSPIAQERKPLGLIIADEISKPIANELTPKVDWELCNNSDWMSQASCVDLCVVLIGSEDINKGKNSVNVFNVIKDFVNNKNRECDLTVVSDCPSQFTSRNLSQSN